MPRPLVPAAGPPAPPLFTLLHRRGSVSSTIEKRSIRTSFLQRLPGVERYYRHLLPLMPWAAAGWRLPPCDLVLSLSHCVAKSARIPAGVGPYGLLHTHAAHAWHQRKAYFRPHGLGRLKAGLAERVLGPMRRWDRRTADGVTHFIAISKTVQRRIRECYDRASDVIYPPVATHFYTPAAVERDDFYLVLSALAPYKRIDLAVAACARLGCPLVVIGAGPEAGRLRQSAGPRTRFMGWQNDETLRDALRRCRALLFPGEEDFGIVPVEAQACGTPVIAFGQGGATETVVPLGQRREPTGVWFEEQTVDSLADAIRAPRGEPRGEFAPQSARRQALQFREERFEEELLAYVTMVVESRLYAPPLPRVAKRQGRLSEPRA